MRGVAVLLLGVLGCADTHEHAPTRARRIIDPPVGPIPGPGIKTTAIANPIGSDTAVLQEGRTLFKRYNCYGCHGLHGGGGMGPSLRDEEWLYGDNDAQIYDSIAEGRGQGMPAWFTRVPERQLWALAAYIQSLETDREPDPPR